MEKWDLYDINKKKLPITINRGEKVPEGCYHLAVNICIFNSNQEMLIQQRASNKDKYADFWDTTARGSAVLGEDSQMAIKRELKEELGIDLYNESLKPYITIYDDYWFSDMYIIKKDIDVNELKLQKTEVKNVKWASKEEIKEMIENNEFIHYKNELIELLFGFFNKRGMTI